ncbi:MAG: hypothetical protein CSB48_00200 [Proteobacteria bacterium]|nr:MAG: hypothetical protein CSB48_00200 [Pseudomonadota bacterium]
MTTNTLGTSHLVSVDIKPLFERALKKIREIFNRILIANQVARERRLLATLTEYQLRDIGLSRSDVHEEIRRGYWDLPTR